MSENAVLTGPPGADRAAGAPHLTMLHRALESFRATADRSDPLDETVLQLVECAALAAAAASRLRATATGSGTEADADAQGAADAEARAALQESLAAARAAVVSASYGVAMVGRP